MKIALQVLAVLVMLACSVAGGLLAYHGFEPESFWQRLAAFLLLVPMGVSFGLVASLVVASPLLHLSNRIR